jgi:DNA-binding response OmpR family regulator
MPKVLVVDDDQALLETVAAQLAGSYQVVATTNPERALALALEHKPDAILVDLLMPKFSGFEICQSLHSLSYTSRIPILVMSGEAGEKYAAYCDRLGARGYIQKPFNCATVKAALEAEIGRNPTEQRADVRLHLRVLLELRGTDIDGAPFVAKVATENVSAGGFLCQCSLPLRHGEDVEVFLEGERERYAGVAHVVRHESPGTPLPWYGFRFKHVTSEWF